VATDSLQGWDWSPERQVLDSGGATLEVYHCSNHTEVGDAIRVADVVLNHLTVDVPREALEQSVRCRAVVACGTGHDHIDVAAASARGIAVATVAGYCTDEVSEHALAFILALARKLLPMSRHVDGGGWEARRMQPVHRLEGRTLGLFGFGAIARRVAEKARPLGLRILALDPFVSGEEMATLGAEKVDRLGDLLEESDYVSLHAPLTDETRKVLDASALERMKPGACLINCSRGELIDEDALCDALAQGHLAGAALDVLAREPMSRDHPLRALGNVLVTPHAAWLSVEAEDELHRRSAAAVLAALRGELPENTVNRDQAGSFWWLQAPPPA
jgi:D-3-phosphoglycerate dehydrogenase